MNIASLLERSALRAPGQPALLRGTRQVHDYAGLCDAAARVAGWLHGQGLQRGDRVALYMPNCVEYLIAMQGIAWAGMAMVPINAKLHPREAAYIVEHSGARLVVGAGVEGGPGPIRTIAAEDLLASAAGHAPAGLADMQPDDLAWLFYTSGTTGRPKGVMLSHRNLLAMTLCFRGDVASVEAGDVKVYAAPMSHGAGLYAFPYVAAGARHVVPVSGGFDALELLGLARELGNVCLFAAPTMVNRLVDGAEQAGCGGEGFRTIVYGGGPMYSADIRRARKVLGPCFVQIYGQGETPMTISALSRGDIDDERHPEWLHRLASVGVRQAAVDVRVVGEDGNPVPSGELGEIVVRGDTVMQGYWNDPVATAATLRDGWLHTGDVGCLDAFGYLTLKDRSKDLIISGGSNIYPREVEEVLLEHPAIVEAAVVGAPDADWGEVVVAFVVGAAGRPVPTGELDAMCLERIARFKRPKRYVQLDALPKNNYGKVLKTELRKLLA